MKKNLFEMGAHFEESWSADNKNKPSKNAEVEVQPPEKHQLFMAKEKRRGKIVTIVKPFCLEKKTLEELLRLLKKKLGTGGALKEDSLEFQGDIPETVRKHLEALGYRFKK